jgi:hypothetical protein
VSQNLIHNIEHWLLYGFVIQQLIVWAGVFIKISVCMMLYRIVSSISASRWWKHGLVVMMVMAAMLGIVVTTTAFLQCKPFDAFWNVFSHLTHCWSISTLAYLSLTWAGEYSRSRICYEQS